MEKRLTAAARKLRQRQTPHEIKLWSLLRSKRFADLKFRRQYPIGSYIVDFCCPTKKLVIELDGGGHTGDKQTKIDVARDAFLQSHGFTVLRIWNHELMGNRIDVLDRIFELVTTPSPHFDISGNPLPRGGEGDHS